MNKEQIHETDFQHLTKFRFLDLTNSICDNDLVKKILTTSPSLQHLNLSYSQRISEDVFNTLKISCPLKEINLSFISKVKKFILPTILFNFKKF